MKTILKATVHKGLNIRFYLIISALLASTMATAQRKATGNYPDPDAFPQPTPDSTSIAVNEEEGKGYRRILRYLEQLYYPFGPRTAEDNAALWEDLEAMPDENDQILAANAVPADWQCVGPFGEYDYGMGKKWTGRVVDVEYTTLGGARVLSASGGLWKLVDVGITSYWVPLSDKLNCQAGGAFCTHPTNANIILLGTGEPTMDPGTGLWKTINGGASWSAAAMSPAIPSAFYKIGYHPTNSNIMFAATNLGFYKSTNGGTSWTRYKSGIVTDFIVKPSSPNVLFISVRGDHFYKSTTTGNTWVQMTSGGVPVSNIGRTNFAICAANDNIIYACVAGTDNYTNGIYKTTDGGASWTPCNYGGVQFHWNQGDYNNTITVSPTDCNLVIAGGGALLRSTNGMDFTSITGQHADQHALEFKSNGSTVYLGNDGGFFYSSNQGLTFTDDRNFLPITQFYSLSVGKSDPKRMGGGSQDNGVIFTRSTSYSWAIYGGDGGGFAVDPFIGTKLYCTYGLTNPTWANSRSPDGGVSWININNNTPYGDWAPCIRTDRTSPTYQYTERNGNVYFKYSATDTWYNISPGGLPFSSDVGQLTVSNGFPSNLYACLGDHRLMVRDAVSNTWINRSAGLPTSSTFVRKVVPGTHSSQRDLAYAVMGGIPTNGAGNKVFVTYDRGASWYNISGNLPNISCWDIMPHPTDPNILILGTETGAFRTDDGGANWYHWWEGMPRGIHFTEMDFVDSTATNGRIWVYAATWGRGIWKREMGASTPVQVDSDDREAKQPDDMPAFRLDQNLAHYAGAPQTAIPYYVGAKAPVRLSLFSESGQLVRVFFDRTVEPGYYLEELTLDDLPSGIYFYTMEAPGFRDTRKMLIVR